MTRDGWLSAHAYLEPLARFCGHVEDALDGIRTPGPGLPCWEDYGGDFAAGVPLLRSPSVALELEPLEDMVRALVDGLSSGAPADKLGADARLLKTDLERGPGQPPRVVDWLLGDEAFEPSSPGLLRYVGWTAMARYLRPVLDSFAGWRDEERWQRNYCPACGALPAMAQLIGVDPGRKRYLSCGRCGTRWRYRRTACPFCESESLKLGIVTVEGEARLRIDHCEPCGGYLKTYNGAGDEALLLADWTSLHLDVIACDRGLKRRAASLYELDPATSR